MVDNRPESGKVGTSRRNVLGLVGGGIVGYSGIPVVNAEHSIDVPIVKQGEKTLTTRSVSVEWWDHVQTARKVREDVASRYQSNPHVKAVGKQLDSEEINGRRKLAVTVYVDERDAGPNLPDEIDGVTVKMDDYRQFHPTCDGNSSFDPVPGGVEFDEESSISELGGTTGCLVTVYGSYHMLTAHHVLDDGSCDADGQSAYQWDTYTGDVEGSFSNPRLDYACVDGSGNLSNGYSENIRYDMNGTETEHEVCGRATNYEVLMSDGTTIYETGRRTDTTTGVIKDDTFGTEYGCAYIYGSEGIWISNNQADGDSGSVSYILEEGDSQFELCAAIVSIVTAAGGIIDTRSCSNTSEGSFYVFENSWGASSEAIYNDRNGNLIFGK